MPEARGGFSLAFFFSVLGRFRRREASGTGWQPTYTHTHTLTSSLSGTHTCFHTLYFTARFLFFTPSCDGLCAFFFFFQIHFQARCRFDPGRRTRAGCAFPQVSERNMCEHLFVCHRRLCGNVCAVGLITFNGHCKMQLPRHPTARVFLAN